LPKLEHKTFLETLEAEAKVDSKFSELANVKKFEGKIADDPADAEKGEHGRISGKEMTKGAGMTNTSFRVL